MYDKGEYLFTEVVWWALVIIFAIALFAYVAKLCWLIIGAQKKPCAVQLEPFLWIKIAPVLLVMAAAIIGELGLHLVWRQAVLCLFLWLFSGICAIIQSKVACRETWRDFMHRQGRETLQVFTELRRFFLWVEEIKNKLSIRARAAICLAAIFAFAGTVALLQYDLRLLTLAVGTFGVAFYICVASFSLHSCGKLLIFWLGYTALFALCVVLMLSPQQNGFFDIMAYIFFVLLYTLLWLLLAGAADDEPVKMGCNIVNTITTIALIVINVSAVWADRNLVLPEPYTAFWSGAQYYSTVILLPLVVAGYLAALLKAIQVYHSKNK